MTETEQSLRHKKLTLDEVQDHKQSDPDVNEVLPGTEDTDLESLIALGIQNISSFLVDTS